MMKMWLIKSPALQAQPHFMVEICRNGGEAVMLILR